MTASGLHHVTIRVADMERSVAFDRDVLGFDVEAPPVTDSPRYRFVVGLRDPDNIQWEFYRDLPPR